MSNSQLIGSSSQFQAVLDQVNTVAFSNCTVLIQGETGTGKEVIAQAVHTASSRRNNRFIVLNCAAIPAALLESELFGHERGAFTGAVAQTVGRFQAADRGTLFLDEIGDLPLELQPKLLRALQEKQFERLGGSHTLQIDVRVIAATNQNLAQMVLARKFRADLYYRLNVFPMALPPLRERRDDIRLLAEHFVSKFADQQGKSIDTIPEDVMVALEAHHWPGNIRELQNVIERGVIMTTGNTLTWLTVEPLTHTDSLLGELDAPASVTPMHAPIRTLADAERAHIIRTLRETDGIIGGRRGAAARLGLPRTSLISRMQRLGISTGLAGIRSAPNLRVMEAVAG